MLVTICCVVMYHCLCQPVHACVLVGSRDVKKKRSIGGVRIRCVATTL